jgi:hypothetical protein
VSAILPLQETLGFCREQDVLLFLAIIEWAAIAPASKSTITNIAILILFPQQGESCEQSIFSSLFFSSVIFVFLNVMRT